MFTGHSATISFDFFVSFKCQTFYQGFKSSVSESGSKAHKGCCEVFLQCFGAKVPHSLLNIGAANFVLY